MNEEMNEKLEESGQMLDEPGAQQPDLPSQPKLPWYRRFSWCLLASLILAVIVIANMAWYVFKIGDVSKMMASGLPEGYDQIFSSMLSAGAAYIIIPFYFIFAIAVCCNVAALLKWNRWTALASSILYVQAGALLPGTTLLTFIPAGLCLISMGWSIKKRR